MNIVTELSEDPTIRKFNDNFHNFYEKHFQTKYTNINHRQDFYNGMLKLLKWLKDKDGISEITFDFEDDIQTFEKRGIFFGPNAIPDYVEDYWIFMGEQHSHNHRQTLIVNFLISLY